MKISCRIEPMRGMAIVLMAVVMPLYILASCKSDNNDRIEIVFDPQTSCTLKEKNVTILVFDSGITRYQIITPTWLMFGKATEPYQYFPDGVYVEQYDSMFNVEASIKADTASYYERRKLWEAKGHVDITNREGVRFQTSQIFWDEQNKTIYSDSFIQMTKGDMINTGVGFISNQDLTIYNIYHSGAEISIAKQRRAIKTDSVIP